MKLTMVDGDIFDACKITGISNLRYAHCISGDCALGAGIAKQFNKEFHIREILQYNCGTNPKLAIGTIARTGVVYNIVTKDRYFQKPEYETFELAISNLRDMLVTDSVVNLAIPRLGCGLDKLEWPFVKSILKSQFYDTDINIYVFTPR